jgi:hypothetical protein
MTGFAKIALRMGWLLLVVASAVGVYVALVLGGH